MDPFGDEDIYDASPKSKNTTQSGVNATDAEANKLRKSVRKLGLYLALIAICSLGVGIADVALSALVICKNATVACPPGSAATTENQQAMAVLFSYVASGIWGSLIVFIVGFWTWRQAKSKNKSSSLLTMLTFLTTVVVIPAMLVFNVVQAYWIAAGVPKTLNKDDPASIVKFVIPIVIAALALLQFFILSAIIMKYCQALSGEGMTSDWREVPAPTEEDATRVAFTGGQYSRGGAGFDPYARPSPPGPAGGFPDRAPYGYGPYAGARPPGPEVFPERAPIVRRNPMSYAPPYGFNGARRSDYAVKPSPWRPY